MWVLRIAPESHVKQKPWYARSFPVEEPVSIKEGLAQSVGEGHIQSLVSERPEIDKLPQTPTYSLLCGPSLLLGEEANP
jgi:hypothetical protein